MSRQLPESAASTAGLEAELLHARSTLRLANKVMAVGLTLGADLDLLWKAMRRTSDVVALMAEKRGQ